MQVWKNASETEAKLFEVISRILHPLSHLMGFVFDTERPRLRSGPEELLKQASALSSGEIVLIKLALDLWCKQGHVQLLELFSLDADVFARVLEAFKILGPKPDPSWVAQLFESTQAECSLDGHDEDLRPGA